MKIGAALFPAAASWQARPVAMMLAVIVAAGGAFASSPLPTPSAARAQEDEPPAVVNVELILDLSGSMSADVGGGETRMEAAQRVLDDVIDALPEGDGVNVGLRVYGHRGDNTEAQRETSCRSTELVVPMNGVDKDALRQQVEAARPIGWTPIALSLQEAGGDFAPAEDVSNNIVLLTDGEETCGGDPCTVASELQGSEAAITTHVVGFALTRSQEEAVGCIAERGGGLNLTAANALELSDALFTILEEIEVVVQTGLLEIEEIGGIFPRATLTFVAENEATPPPPLTLADDNRVELPVGRYDVTWTNPSGRRSTLRVAVDPDRTTWIRGSLLAFPQGAGETYVVRDLAGVVVWQAPFERGDEVWVLPGIYTIELAERVGDPILIMAQIQTLPGSVTRLDVFASP
jgi:hypothetical protein